jgi:hypothetical protein
MTAQMHEKLILNGEQTSMTSCPEIPEWNDRITRSDKPLMNTACWRGYVGTWEIKANMLFLVSLEGMYHLEGSEPLFADWFSGTLWVPRGKMLQYIHMGFESIYESELLIEVEKGLVVRRKTAETREHPKTPPE